MSGSSGARLHGLAGRSISTSPPAWAPLLLWLCFAGLVSFALFLASRAGLLLPIIAADVTGIAALIGIMFILGTAHCGYRMTQLSREFVHLEALNEFLGTAQEARVDEALDARGGLAAAFFLAVRDQARLGGAMAERSAGTAELAALLSEQARRQHDAGWFLAGLLVKLGLLGTVVGFVMMLRSVDAIESFDVSDVQRLLTLMSGGMGVALYTTLVGLVTSIALGFQYLCADQAANRFVAVAAETALRKLPRPAKQSPGAD